MTHLLFARPFRFVIASLFIGMGLIASLNTAYAVDKMDVLRRENLVAWCIVPFDAKKRGPAERALMLKELGITRCAYDWREEHVASFEQEILEYKKHGIEYFAFWSVQEEAFQLFEKHGLHPQIWQIVGAPAGETQEQKVEAAAQRMVDLAKRTQAMGCKLGLYNHGGWDGEPKNLVAVCKRLRELGHNHVGIVYNFHHGHGHIEDWAESFAMMKPYLHCLNLDGMNPNEQPKILGIGKGAHELEMIRTVVESGYDGPIGIIDHRDNLDAYESLLENRDGLEWVRKEIEKPGSGGPRPAPAVVPAMPSNRTGHVFPGSDAYRKAPITVDVRATIRSRDQYNILMASDTKASVEHWELFSMNGSGMLTVYLPGRTPDHVHSQAMICDGQAHTLSMTLAQDQVQLFVDGKRVAEQAVALKDGGASVPGDLAIGRLVEGQFGFNGIIEWARISKGVREITSEIETVPTRDNATVGLWEFKDGKPLSNASATDLTQSVVVRELPYDADLVTSLVIEAQAHGDAVRGAAVFTSPRIACLSCHKAGKDGGTVGPDLTAIAKERKLDHLVESVLWPRRDVKTEFVNWQIVTADGKVLTGYKHSSEGTMVTLRDPASGKLTEIAKSDIEEEIAVGTVMPNGLTAAMTKQQQLDLIRFLSELGKDGRPLSDELLQAIAHSQMHGPAEFPITKEPMHASSWPNSTQPVNRDRIYDFYSKQAEYFRQQHHTPMLLAPFPGLDGGHQGHWGNQNDTVWADGRWNDAQLGSMQAGVFHGDGINVTRGVCLQLGDDGDVSACFNPDTLKYEAVWSNGFVSFDPFRHGFIGGLKLAGTSQPIPEQTAPNKPFKYHGFYRDGKRVVFAYRIGNVEYLDAPWAASGRFVREVAPVEQHSMKEVTTSGGARQWPQVVSTKIIPGTGKPYAVDTIELPYDNPWKVPVFCGDHDFLPDGTALVCTMQGDVWKVTGLDSGIEAPGQAQWTRFASGLHHALGLVVSDGQIYVQCRDQLTRLSDLNSDGEADFYECFSNAFITSPAGHDYICGLQRDSQGNFFMASGNQGLVRISADGQKAEVIATGFRNPDGLGILPDGTVTLPVSEGDWTPASAINTVRNASTRSSEIPLHYGYGGPKSGKPPEFPFAYLPRGMDNSSGGQVYVGSEKFGPLKHQLLHFSFGAGTWFAALRDEVDDQLQAGIVPMAGDFLSGVHRARFRDVDGQLYVSGMSGWGSYTPNDGCFQRVRFTGGKAQLPVAFHVHQNGVRIKFAEPVDKTIASDVKQHFAQAWNYRYSGAYGSVEYSTTHPGVAGHDPMLISGAHVLADGYSIFLEIPDIQPVNQLHIRMHVNADESTVCGPTGSGHDLFVTVNKLDRPFVGFAGYEHREKTIAAHPLLSDLALNAVQVPNPWRHKIPSSRKIEIETGKNLTYGTREFSVKAGEAIAFTLSNPDVVPHNWVLVRSGSLRTVGELGNQLIANPEAYARHYIPESSDILAHTDIVGPRDSQTIYFKAPEEPGRYPFLCTFPGHWMVMNGEMIVESK